MSHLQHMHFRAPERLIQRFQEHVPQGMRGEVLRCLLHRFVEALDEHGAALCIETIQGNVRIEPGRKKPCNCKTSCSTTDPSR